MTGHLERQTDWFKAGGGRPRGQKYLSYLFQIQISYYKQYGYETKNKTLDK